VEKVVLGCGLPDAGGLVEVERLLEPVRAESAQGHAKGAE
jgi:hypothetical protein